MISTNDQDTTGREELAYSSVSADDNTNAYENNKGDDLIALRDRKDVLQRSNIITGRHIFSQRSGSMMMPDNIKNYATTG